MTLLARHAVASAVVVIAVLVGAGFFVVARPAYRPHATTVTVAMTNEHRYSDSAVIAAFAAHGITLQPPRRLSGVRLYFDRRQGMTVDAFEVAVYAPGARVVFDSSGPRPMFDAHFANLAISYGGHDRAFAARVAAAAAEIKHS
jgi:hypothetical protein